MKITWPARREKAVLDTKKSPGLAFDCELAARIKEGDRKALLQLVERHIGRARTYLQHRVGEGHDQAIDRVLTATFNDALRQLSSYADGSATTPLELWLIRLAERHLSRLGREPTLELQPSSSQPSKQSDLDRFRAALSHIPDRYRGVLVLAVVEQMPAGDIAAALGVSPSLAMRRLRGALKRLGSALEKQEVR